MTETSYSGPGNMHSSFSSLVQSLLPKDTLLRTYLNVRRMQKSLEQILQRCHSKRHVCWFGATQSDMPACTVQLHRACMLARLHLFGCVLYVMCTWRFFVYYKSTAGYLSHILYTILDVFIMLTGARVASLCCINNDAVCNLRINKSHFKCKFVYFSSLNKFPYVFILLINWHLVHILLIYFVTSWVFLIRFQLHSK